MTFNISIPKRDSARYKVLRLAFKHGGVTLEQVVELLPAHSRDALRLALTENEDRGRLERVGNVFIVTGPVDSHFRDVAPTKAEVYVGQIVAPRQPAPIRPLSPKNMGWLVHADKLRADVSFKTAGLALPSGYVY